jgi:uncharacterized hydrophobic protein (TIGR00271 family)
MSTKFTLIPASDMLVFAPVCDFSAIENLLFEVKTLEQENLQVSEIVKSALFVCRGVDADLVKMVEEKSTSIDIRTTDIDSLMMSPESVLENCSHVIVSGSLTDVKQVLKLAMQKGFSVGIIPQTGYLEVAKLYGIPLDKESALTLALQQPQVAIDVVLCNDEIILYRATFGRLPLLDTTSDTGRLVMFGQAIKRFAGLRLLKFSFTTNNGRAIETAACGCMLIQQHGNNLASRRFVADSTASDGMVTLVISAPLSLIEYIRFLVQITTALQSRMKLPNTVGVIKSKTLQIESEVELDVTIDGESKTQTPLHCETLPQAVKLNVGESYLTELQGKGTPATKETLNIGNLPAGKDELNKAKKKAIPFFPYASEERFRDLFQVLREDAKTDSTYLSLMVLSTLLAAVGLYQNSSAVVIGAMLLAPLMTPIVSLSMGMLRRDVKMSRQSALKIAYGVMIALLAAALMTQLFPHKPITEEMQARLNPTLLDLAVAIIAGVAGAYTKAYKEILSSLAGVAIAVALVPPLAVAGIGLGRLDLEFFIQAFLLFSTNLVGILLAASFTFRILGYSPAVVGKTSLRLVLLMMFLIAIPLYLSYDDIVSKIVMEKSWKHERFLVNGKYIIVQKALLSRHRHKDIMTMDILAREQLTRDDLTSLRKKIENNFSRKFIIRAKIIYIP